MKNLKFWLVALLVFVGSAGPIAAHAAPFSSLVVFGDSLSDSGNNAVVLDAQGIPRTPTPISGPGFVPEIPYASGRYSNGPVWVERFAASLGLSAKASLLGGTNFAFGGATTGPAGGGFPFSLQDQLGMYLGSTGGVASSNALYIVEGGGNDARAAITVAAGGGDPTSIIEGYAANIASIITTLAGAGATQLLLVNTPDVGLTPEAISNGPLASALGTQIAAAMNGALSQALASLLPNLAIDLSVLDAFKIVDDVVANPSAFGLTDATTTCAASPACIADPSGTFFWDGIHPTAAGHEAIARAALAMIPEPATWLLMVFALGLLLRRATLNGRR